MVSQRSLDLSTRVSTDASRPALILADLCDRQVEGHLHISICMVSGCSHVAGKRRHPSSKQARDVAEH